VITRHFVTAGWALERAYGLYIILVTRCWSRCVFCLEQTANDIHVAHAVPLFLRWFTFLVPAYS